MKNPFFEISSYSYFKLKSENFIRNDKLIDLVNFIGMTYKNEYPTSKESNFKKGIRVIQGRYPSARKKEIRRFLTPGDGLIKISYSSYDIYESIIEIVFENETILKECKEINKGTSKCVCKEALILKFYALLDLNANILKERSYSLYSKFKQDKHRCSQIK